MRQQRGFTLIELMIVLGLMGLVLTLVGPMLQHQVERAEASAEYIEASQFVNNSAKVAFLRNQKILIVFDGKALTRQIDGQIEHIEFNHLFFPKQQLEFNSHGYSLTSGVKVVAGRRELEISVIGQVAS